MGKKLTAKQQGLFDKLTRFQQSIVLGLIAGMEDYEAYKHGIGKAKTKNAGEAAVSRMKKIPKVKAFLDAMAAELVSAAIMTREQALERLSHLAATGKSESACIAAIGKLAEMQGWYAPSKTMEVPAPPGVVERYSQEDYEAAQSKLDERFG